MVCWHCGSELIWNSDFSYEDYGLEGEGIITALSCTKCNAEVEVYLATGGEDGYN